MATIHDLNTSILDMSDEKAFELIKNIRYERRIAKGKFAKKKTSSKRPSKTINIKSMLAAMSTEARLKLLAELEGAQ